VRLIAIVIAAMVVAPAMAQTSGKAEIFSSQAIRTQLAGLAEKAKQSGSSGSTLGDYTSHALKLSSRTASGGAEVHAHFDDVIVVTEGSATLITGGTVVAPQTGADGETKGTSIQNGSSQKISVGDIIHIPAGTPHQMLINSGVLFSAFVVKVKEP